MDKITNPPIPIAEREHASFSALKDWRCSMWMVAIGSLIVTAVALSRSFTDGRLAVPMTHNDVNYFIEGIQHVTNARKFGFLTQFINDVFFDSLHAPLATYQAMLSYAVFGINDWAPYVSNIVFVAIFLGYCMWLVRDSSLLVKACSLGVIMAMPISGTMVSEFAPELTSSLFTAIGSMVALRSSLLTATLKDRFYGGILFGLAFLFHPSAFAFILIAIIASTGLAFAREVLSSRRFDQIGRGLKLAVLNFLACVWLGAVYILPRGRSFWSYFYDAILNPATSTVWANTFSRREHLSYYVTGNGGDFMLGHLIWPYIAIMAVAFLVAAFMRDRAHLIILCEVLILVVLFWLVPTLSPTMDHLFASAFGFMCGLLIVVSLRVIFEGMRPASGAALVSIFAFLFVSLQTTHAVIANTPRSIPDRDAIFAAIDRFKADFIGNASSFTGTSVYMTNIGAYAPNILQYYVLKDDPYSDWVWSSLWTTNDADKQMEFIRASKQMFVIAADPNNGFTYSSTAKGVEGKILDMMLNESSYMPIDRFLGPGGGSITVFQRRVAFGGYRPISGIAHRHGLPDGVRTSTGPVTYLKTHSARAVDAELLLELTGKPGQRVTISVNLNEVADFTLADGMPRSIKQGISLVKGENDVVLRYATPGSPVLFNRLLVVPALLAGAR